MVDLRSAVAAAVVLFGGVACQLTTGEEPRPLEGPGVVLFSGVSDASAAVAVGQDRMLVADDETNVLHVYSLKGGAPLASHDLTSFLGTTDKHPEADIEDAARVGDRVYWITSHGRSKKGKLWKSRYLFFATEVVEDGGAVAIRGVHTPFRGLVEALLADPALAALGIDRATRLDARDLRDEEERRLAPQADGLNIEGLGASPEGERLYIGLRNPLAPGVRQAAPRAIVIPLENPAEVVEGRAAPRFGPPLLWDLGGSGIRSMLWSAAERSFLIVAGPRDDEEGFSLYRWSSPGDPVRVMDLGGPGLEWKPEALVSLDSSRDLLVLSDDGSMRIPAAERDCLEGEWHRDGTCENKHLRDLSRRSFRGYVGTLTSLGP